MLSVPAAAALHPRAGAPHPHLPDCERVHHRGRGRGQGSNLPAAHRQGRIGTDLKDLDRTNLRGYALIYICLVILFSYTACGVMPGENISLLNSYFLSSFQLLTVLRIICSRGESKYE